MTDYAAAFQEILARYASALEALDARSHPGAGLFGLGRRKGDDPCHDALDREVAALLTGLAGLLAAGFEPQPAVDGHWASGYFAFARDKGFLPTGRFNTLNSPISRLQIAELASKTLGLERTGTDNPFSDTDLPVQFEL